MHSLQLFSLLCLLSSLNAYAFTGDGTAYANGFSAPDGGAGYNCGFRWLAPPPRTYFAALNAPQYGSSENCGRCAKVHCVDSRCTSSQTITVMIIDKCPECKEGDLDFSVPAFSAITGLNPDRVRVAWDWVPCESMIDTSQSAKLATKEGSNPWWFAFQVSNTATPISSFRIQSGGNWMDLSRQDYGFFQGSSGSGLSFPVEVEAIELSGRSWSKTINNIDQGTVQNF